MPGVVSWYTVKPMCQLHNIMQAPLKFPGSDPPQSQYRHRHVGWGPVCECHLIRVSWQRLPCHCSHAHHTALSMSRGQSLGLGWRLLVSLSPVLSALKVNSCMPHHPQESLGHSLSLPVISDLNGSSLVFYAVYGACMGSRLPRTARYPGTKRGRRALWDNILHIGILSGSQALSSCTSLLNCTMFLRSATTAPSFMGEETEAQRS